MNGVSITLSETVLTDFSTCLRNAVSERSAKIIASSVRLALAGTISWSRRSFTAADRIDSVWGGRPWLWARPFSKRDAFSSPFAPARLDFESVPRIRSTALVSALRRASRSWSTTRANAPAVDWRASHGVIGRSSAVTRSEAVADWTWPVGSLPVTRATRRVVPGAVTSKAASAPPVAPGASVAGQAGAGAARACRPIGAPPAESSRATPMPDGNVRAVSGPAFVLIALTAMPNVSPAGGPAASTLAFSPSGTRCRRKPRLTPLSLPRPAMSPRSLRSAASVNVQPAAASPSRAERSWTTPSTPRKAALPAWRPTVAPAWLIAVGRKVPVSIVVPST